MSYPDNLSDFPETAASDLFAMEVSGDSMAPKIEHGDLVIVKRHRPTDPLLPGHIYLVRQQGRTTCKYLMPAADGYCLTAEKPTLFPEQPMTDSHEILGRVIEARKIHTLSRPVLHTKTEHGPENHH